MRSKGFDVDNEPQVDLSEFDPNGDYTPKQLSAFASAMLKEDRKNMTTREVKDTGILLPERLKVKRRYEIYVDAGIPDPSFSKSPNESNAKTIGDGQAMYWRMHKDGRPVNSKKSRRDHGSGFYRS
jgi:hypothetical protein